MNEKIAEIAFEKARIGIDLNPTEWKSLPKPWHKWYIKYADEVIAEHERRKPPVVMEDHWMILMSFVIIKTGDKHFSDDGSWELINERGMEGEKVGQRKVIRLVRAPVSQPASDGGWMKRSERFATEDDAVNERVEVIMESGRRHIAHWECAFINDDPVKFWRVLTPPPTPEPEKVDECLDAYCSAFNMDSRLLSGLSKESINGYSFWEAAWNYREASINASRKEGA